MVSMDGAREEWAEECIDVMVDGNDEGMAPKSRKP
jgi:hypothetical protein